MRAVRGRLWNENARGWKGVREWKVVAKKARKASGASCMARAFGVRAEKNSELPDGSQGEKLRCLAVFGGNQVSAETWGQAQFLGQGSSPASQEA